MYPCRKNLQYCKTCQKRRRRRTSTNFYPKSLSPVDRRTPRRYYTDPPRSRIKFSEEKKESAAELEERDKQIIEECADTLDYNVSLYNPPDGARTIMLGDIHGD